MIFLVFFGYFKKFVRERKRKRKRKRVREEEGEREKERKRKKRLQLVDKRNKRNDDICHTEHQPLCLLDLLKSLIHILSKKKTKTRTTQN
jgi:hypothetical protein